MHDQKCKVAIFQLVTYSKLPSPKLIAIPTSVAKITKFEL